MSQLNYLRKWKCFTAFLVTVLLMGVTSVKAQYFTIDQFRAEIKISDDGSFTVKETIELTFDRERHGIFREIPYKYVDELGKVSTTPLKVLAVEDETGKSWSYKVTRPGGFVNIRIGDPDCYVVGKQVYVITYKVERALLFFDDHDELYWNVTGNEWKAPIRTATTEIIFETDKTPANFTGSCYTGRYGSNESECGWEYNDNRVIFTMNRSLGAGEGFTLALGWEKGIVQAPTAWQKFWWAVNLGENWVFIVPLFVLVFMIRHWYRRGRDPKVREAVTVAYEPPKFDGKPLTPGEVGTLLDEQMDQRDITATVIGLAVKGYLKIEEVKIEGLISLLDKTDYNLIKVKDADSNLGAFEINLFNDIFTGDVTSIMISEMKNKFYKNIGSLKKSVFQQLVNKKYFLTSPVNVQGRYMIVGFLIIFFGIFLAFFTSFDSPWKGTIAFGLAGLIIVIFSKAMPVKTHVGALAYMEILGFLEFMKRADKDRLERMGEKDLFYKYLPYAIALDVVDNWTEAFKDIYQEPPQWYKTPYAFTNFNPRSFSHSLSNITTTLGSAMYSAPRGSGVSGGRSGGGGGGFSGGGSGGGGGGSW